MAEINWGLVILISVVVLINLVGLGMIFNRKTSSDRQRIKELEEQLAESQKELEGYRSEVNEHFMKTSMLFGQMTDSYRAVFMHLAEGSQNLCSSDAALLKTTGGLLSLDHEGETERSEPEESGQSEGKNQQEEPGQSQSVEDTETVLEDVSVEQAEVSQEEDLTSEEQESEYNGEPESEEAIFGEETQEGVDPYGTSSDLTEGTEEPAEGVEERAERPM